LLVWPNSSRASNSSNSSKQLRAIHFAFEGIAGRLIGTFIAPEELGGARLPPRKKDEERRLRA
jgi:hypothetical protein